MHTIASRLPQSLLLLLVAFVVAACGSDEPSSDSGSDVGSLEHADGTIALQDDRIVLTPTDGQGETRTFEIGPEVEVARLRAIEASGAPARVSFRPEEEPPVAAAVSEAPAAGEGGETYEGTVVSVDEQKLVVKGSDGERTFDVSGADAGVFDVPHLQEHADSGEPIRVYTDPEAPDVGIAYEDA